MSGPEGLCHKIDVKMLPGMPESVRRFAKASFEGWVFEAQRVNNRPVEGQVSMRFALSHATGIRQGLPHSRLSSASSAKSLID